MLTRRIPVYYLILTLFIGGVISYTLFLHHKSFINIQLSPQNRSSGTSSGCKTNIVRLARYQYIKPVLYADRDCESEDLALVKESILTFIEHEQETGRLAAASVYLQLLSKPGWTGINLDERYHPASLNKVPLLLTYMRMNESFTGMLDTKIFYNEPDTSLSVPFFISKKIVPGNSYTIRELLHHMIAYSDNDATNLLVKHVNLDLYYKLYSDLGLEKPDLDQLEMFVNPKQYSLFMRVIYSSSYLSPPSSEYAAQLLTECDFKYGLLKQMPPSVNVAHKFGEWSNGDVYELHESGIVYMDNNPYLITIMTKGHDFKTLAEIISSISNIVYINLVQNKS